MGQEKKTEKKQRISNRQLIILAVIVFLMILVTIVSLIYVRKQAEKVRQEPQSYMEYRRHYAFITESFEDTFWSEVYQEARQFGEEEEVYLEWMGIDLAIDYSKEELLKIAIAAGVDGIILEGDESEAVRELVNKAEEEGIPVVTVMTDSAESRRQSFVGIGGYNLGREYGRQIVRLATKETKKALVFVDDSEESGGEDSVMNGIKETLANEGNHLNLDLETVKLSEDAVIGEDTVTYVTLNGKADAFLNGEDMAIRYTLLKKEELPEILICLNEKDTVSVYQAVMDCNLEGKVNILGYSVTDEILNAIDSRVMASTVAVDTRQMGSQSVKALDEYIENDHVDEIITVYVNTVTLNNIKEYLKDVPQKHEK